MAAEEDGVKINISPNIPCAFLLFKAIRFFQFSFRENRGFENVSVVNV